MAGWIDYDVSTMLRAVDDSEKVTTIVCTLGGQSAFPALTGLTETVKAGKVTGKTYTDGRRCGWPKKNFRVNILWVYLGVYQVFVKNKWLIKRGLSLFVDSHAHQN